MLSLLSKGLWDYIELWDNNTRRNLLPLKNKNILADENQISIGVYHFAVQ